MQSKNGKIILAACAVVALLLAAFLWLHHRAADISEPPVAAHGGAPPPRDFVGVGVALRMNPQTGTPMIEQVISNTPAARAGLIYGQILSRIDNTPTDGLKLKQCVDLLRGPEGSVVHLELISPDRSATNSIELTREKIKV